MPAPRNGLLKPITIKASSIEYKPSCTLMDMPTIIMIKPAANKAPSEWHGFNLYS